MKKKSIFFYVGLLAAVFSAASFFDISGVEAVSRRIVLATLPAELRLAEEVGIISLDELGSGKLSRAMTRREFGLILQRALQMLGHPAGASQKAMASFGIFVPRPVGARVTRKQALEAICRVVTALEAQGLIATEGLKTGSFADYQPPAKYGQALGFLKTYQVVRGFGRDIFGTGRSLQKRDGIYLVFRLYEKVSSVLMSKNPPTTIAFVDLAKDHPAMKSITDLFKAGAFDLVPVRPSFDGNRWMDLNSLSALCQGILDKSAIKCLLEFEAAPEEKAKPATRIQLARILEKMAGLGTVRESVTARKPVTYLDVPSDSPDCVVLEKLHQAGINLGYPGGHLFPDERVTWFEAVGTLYGLLKAVRFSEAAEPTVEEVGNRLLLKKDIEDFANLIRAKRAKIRSILRAAPLREEPPQGSTN
jgi:hypothetical protein